MGQDVLVGNEEQWVGERRQTMTRIQGLVLIAIAALLISLCCVEVMRGEDPRMANREAVERDLRTLALRAQEYYARPAATGGGQGAFDNSRGGEGLCLITQLASKPLNSNGSYIIGIVTASSVVLTGVGTQLGNDGCPVSVVEIVFPDSVYVMYPN
jgi:hypothetical protein